jgi:hypothetical protein
LPQIDQDSATLLRNPSQCEAKLGRAITAQGAKNFAGEALGVHASQDVLPFRNVAQNERDMIFLCAVAVQVQDEITKFGRDSRLSQFLRRLHCGASVRIS